MARRPILYWLALILAAPWLAGVAQADPAGQADEGGWQVNEGRAALTGAATITAVLQSSEPITNMVGQPERATLVLRCSEGVLTVYVAWPQVLAISGTALLSAQTQTMVLWRRDDTPVAVNFWDRADGGVAAGKFTTGGARKLLAAISTTRRMVVRMTGQTTQDATFALGEIGSIAKRVDAACGGARP